MAKRLGGGDYLYESVDNWHKTDIPGVVSDVATDSEDRVYLAVRTAQGFDDNTGAILVFDRDGNHLNTFGEETSSARPTACGSRPTIPSTSPTPSTTASEPTPPSGDPGMVLGVPGEPGPAGRPFNRPTLAVPSPVSDDLCSCPTATGRTAFTGSAPPETTRSRRRRVPTPQARLGELRDGAHRLVGRRRSELP